MSIQKSLTHATNRNWPMAAVESAPERIFAAIYRWPTHRSLRRVDDHWELEFNPDGHQAGKHETWHLPRARDALRLTHIGEYPKVRVLQKYMRPLSELMSTRQIYDAVDVGAYIGEFSRRMQGDVLAMEPDPRNAALLERNTDERTEVVQAAAWMTDDELTFHAAADGSESSLTVIDSGGRDDDLRVSARRVSSVCDEHGFEPDVVKIDAEGSEPEAVAGAVPLRCPIVVDVGPERGGLSTASATRALLESHDYRVHGPSDDNVLAAVPSE